MTKKDFERVFWKQYLMLEQEFIETLNYVEFDTLNFNTYSNKFAKLLLQIGSEMDNVLREIGGFTGRNNIADYANYILGKYPNITTQNVKVANKTNVLNPFNGWNISQASQSLSFWKNYNDVKHDRIQKYKEASLEAVVNGIAALYVIEMYQLKELYLLEQNEFQSNPSNESEFFILENWTCHFRGSKAKLDNPIMDDDDGEIFN